MRRMLVSVALAAGLLVPQSAEAAIGSVMGGAVTCAVQANGQRFCGTGAATVPSFDGTPIDVSVAFPPAPASGPDGPYPVIGLYHGWGGSKIVPTPTATSDPPRALSRGYAVFSMTDRGWGRSCFNPRPMPACATGYIHLMHNAYEVHDAQYLLGLLADDGVIDPQKIGAIGGSYGGGVSIALGALRDRVQNKDGTLSKWTSPGGKPMQIAATTPEFTWSDLDYALMPNGSTLDYVADSPYRGPLGNLRVGVQKQQWNGSLFVAGQFFGNYAPAGRDPQADIVGWEALTHSR